MAGFGASDSLCFMSMCPSCKDMRDQLGYGFRTLIRLLGNNQPIAAHCAVCKKSWPISPNERAELALLLLTDRDP
jgi:hypothetical protein